MVSFGGKDTKPPFFLQEVDEKFAGIHLNVHSIIFANKPFRGGLAEHCQTLEIQDRP
jgi:hypothetical protein